MKKFGLIAVLLILALGILILPAAAQDDLTSLARYFPSDAPLFASFSTDDASIQMLDDLASKFGSLSPGGLMPGALLEALDDAASQVQPGGTFATTFRSWLGDSAAIGMFKLQEQTAQNPVPAVTIAISITDQDKAEAFFESVPNAGRYTLSDGDGYTLYTPNSSNSSDPYFLFRSDVVLITGDQALVDGGGVLTDTLAESDAFTTAVGLLPEDAYKCVGYVDTPAILKTAMADSSSSDRAAMEMFTSLTNALQPQTFGLTLLDNRSLTLDLATPIDASASSSLTLARNDSAIDPTFAGHVPAHSILVQGNNLYQSYQNAIANLRALASAAQDENGLSTQNLNTAMFGISFVVRGMTGMDVADALGWMTGDYALAFSFSPSFSDVRNLNTRFQSLPVDFGIIVEATDPDAAQQVYDGLSHALENLPADNITLSEETLDGGTQALVFAIDSPEFNSPIELLAATGNGVFAFGTRRMVTAAVNPSGDSLSTDPEFVEASGYMLDNASALFFLGKSSLEPLARAMTGSGNPQYLRTQGKQFQAVLDLISSASISSASLPDGNGTVTRFVWTMPE